MSKGEQTNSASFLRTPSLDFAVEKQRKFREWSAQQKMKKKRHVDQ
jgi:hypothetical protein